MSVSLNWYSNDLDPYALWNRWISPQNGGFFDLRDVLSTFELSGGVCFGRWYYMQCLGLELDVMRYTTLEHGMVAEIWDGSRNMGTLLEKEDRIYQTRWTWSWPRCFPSLGCWELYGESSPNCLLSVIFRLVSHSNSAPVEDLIRLYGTMMGHIVGCNLEKQQL